VAFLVAGVPLVGHCDAEGQCTTVVPECGGSSDDCTDSCPVVKICQLCADEQTCADPQVACNPDGSCGETTWICPEDVEPEIQCPANCPVTDACQLCEDGSCAGGTPSCNPDGSCGPTKYSCPEDGYDPCADKADGDACSLCAPTDAACSETAELKSCVDGECMSGGSVERLR
jgi:hypothetical protein